MLRNKDFIKYQKVRKTLKPLDLIMFKGSNFVSNLTCHLGYGIDLSAFSHCGIIVTSEILDHPHVHPGKIYLWESTMNNSIGQGVPNIEGKLFSGIQLRDLDLLLPAYFEDSRTTVAVCHLKDEFRYARDSENAVGIFSEIFNKYNGIHCKSGCIASLCSFLFGEKEKWLFCSEFVSHVYQDLGLFPNDIDPEKIMPMDFIDVRNQEIPLIVEDPIYIQF